MRDFFTRHPQSVGESYWEHMGVALSFAGELFTAAFAALVHAFLPACCEKTASRKIAVLHERMITKRNASNGAPFQAEMAEKAHR